MKYPALLSFEDVLPQLAQFDSIIDVRSPAEFAEDHIPGAINCPVLDDEQRVRVGTLYKQVNAFEAKKVGAALVAKNIAHHIEAQFIDKPREWKPLIYCWRGGNRSGAMAHILAKIGWPAIQLEGGYKAYRQHINTTLSTLPSSLNLQVLCGPTGSGKSRLLQILAAQGAQVLDLEKLAAHRGSVLGNLPSEAQPSQKMFDSRIWELLQQFESDRPVFVESESKKVGSLRVPDALMEKMRAAPCISVQLSITNRVKLLMEDYPHFIQNPAILNAQLSFLVTLHGHEKIKRWHAMALSGDITTLVTELLTDHYDPAYQRSIERNFSQASQARILGLNEITKEDFLEAAGQLHQP